MSTDKKAKKNANNEKTTWSPFRSLQNYKGLQAKVAKDKGKYEQLMAATTLTAARRVVYGK